MFSLSSCIHELPFSALVAFFCNPKIPVKRACVFTLLKWSQSKCRTLPRWCRAGEGRVTLSEVRACCCHCVGLCRWRFSLKCKCVVVLSIALAFICAVISERNDIHQTLTLYCLCTCLYTGTVKLQYGCTSVLKRKQAKQMYEETTSLIPSN